MIYRLSLAVFVFLFALSLGAARAHEQDWYPFNIDLDQLGGPLDFSYLNKTIGERDWIGTDGTNFTIYDDTARKSTSRLIRFFGVNIGFDAAFPTAGESRQLADRLARLGVNLVRLHQLDLVLRSKGAPRVGGILTTAPYPSLDPEAITRLRGLIDALKNRGIYVGISIHSGYTFRSGDGVYVGGTEFPASKPLNEIFPKMIDLQIKFAESLISSLNLGNDPALAFVEINNEGSLINSWEKGKIAVGAAGPIGDELRAWKAELFGADTPQGFDLYTSLDRHYFERVRRSIRSVAPHVLVIGTQMDFGGLANYTSDQNADYRDAHFYIDHYNFPNGLWNWEDWRQRDTSMIGSGLSELMRVSLLRDLTKPFMISEFNEPWPNSHGLEILPITASFACLQDWGGLAFYDYAHHAFSGEPNFPHEFSLSGDLSKLAVFGISAAIFRQGLVSRGRDTVVIPIPRSVRVAATESGANGNVLTFFERRGQLNKRDILQHRIGLDPGEHKTATHVTEENGTSGVGPVEADNGQLRYWSKNLYVIDAPRVAGYIGFLPSRKSVSTHSTSVTSLSSEPAFRSVIVLSLDGRPIHESSHMVLSVTGATARSSVDGIALTMKPYKGQPGWWTVKGTNGASPSDKLSAGNTPTWMQRTPLSFF